MRRDVENVSHSAVEALSARLAAVRTVEGSREQVLLEATP